jgi:opacity protein-like surface antigen
MNMIRIRQFCILLACFAGLAGRAQSSAYLSEIGIGAGTFIYQGDLTHSQAGSLKGVKPMLQLWYARPFTSYLSWRADLSIGSIQSDESRFSYPSWKQSRNFSFSTPVTEISGRLVYNFYGDNGKDTYHTITPYLMAGAGMSFLKVQRDWSRMDTTLFNSKSATASGLGTDTLRRPPSLQIVLPVGAGVRWAVTPSMSVHAEATYRFVFSDYVDGFSYAANKSARDGYYGISLGVSWTLGNHAVRCPVVRK